MFCHFPTVASQSDPYMINPSIEALIFYFDMRKKLIAEFVNFMGNRQQNFIGWHLECVYIHSKFEFVKFSLSVFHKIYKFCNQFFSHVKVEN